MTLVEAEIASQPGAQDAQVIERGHTGFGYFHAPLVSKIWIKSIQGIPVYSICKNPI